jgi:Domain of unknown function (DUF2804), C-terminal/Domain of unknown function (DUF2804), N-terminal
MPKSTMSRAPEMLIAPDGQPNYGNFAGPIPTLNHDAFDYTKLHRWPWSAIGGLANKLLKRWQFVGVIDEGLVLGAAVVDLQYVGSGFTYLYDRATGEIVGKDVKAPLGMSTAFSESAGGGVSQIQFGGALIRMDNTPRDGKRELQVDVPGLLTADVAYTEHGDGVSTVSRMAMYGFGHTYKFVGLPATGHVVVRGEKRPLTKNAMAILDWSSATPPRNTIWNWAAAAGHDENGKSVGINFSSGIVTDGHTENSVWVDGQPTMIGGVNFFYDQQNITGHPWRLATPDGAIDLTFAPEHERLESVNLGLAASRLHQPFGGFTGTIGLGSAKHKVTLYGFCEEHFAKW